MSLKIAQPEQSVQELREVLHDAMVYLDKYPNYLDPDCVLNTFTVAFAAVDFRLRKLEEAAHPQEAEEPSE